MSTLTVKVLSNVSSSEDVFDCLIQVQRLDTGEIGELLCSHCCRWPKDMLDKAKWIEGCYTPQSYEADPRLLLGYHPSSVTRWEYEEKGEEVFVHLRTELTAPRVNDLNEWLEIEVAFLPPLRFYNEENLCFLGVIPRYRFMRRLWQTSQEGRDAAAAIQAFYRSLSAVVETGLVPEWAARTAWFSVLCTDPNALEYIYINWAVYQPMFYEEYADALIVVTAEPSAGFMPAVAITEVVEFALQGRQRSRLQRFADAPPKGTLIVTEQALLQGADQNGWHPSVPTKLVDINIYEYEGYEETVVMRDDPENGWAIAFGLDCFRQNLDHISVEKNQLAQGFAQAMLITELI